MVDFDEKELLGENEHGYEFYISKRITKYAVDKGFENMIVAYVKKKGETDFEAIMLIQDNKPIFEARTIEAVASHIDILAIAKEF